MLIGNLPLETSEDELFNFFASIGEVSAVEILKDKNGRGRGFAFVRMAKPELTNDAITKMHNAEFKGRLLCVSPAETTRKQAKKPINLFGFCR